MHCTTTAVKPLEYQVEYRALEQSLNITMSYLDFQKYLYEACKIIWPFQIILSSEENQK